jgi:membrane associated rhomboid family serine protease
MMAGRISLLEIVVIAFVGFIVIALLGAIGSGRSRSFSAALFGLLLGAFVGFLLRPSVPFVGQLPFRVVVTRGANLTGVNRMFQPAAKRSFNYMAAGGVIGAVVLGVVGGAAGKQKSGAAQG